MKLLQEQPEEFHESLRQIPMRWRSSLSSIMTSMASNGGFDEQGAANDEGGTGSGSGAVDMDVGDGKTGPGGERKVMKPSHVQRRCAVSVTAYLACSICSVLGEYRLVS